MVSYLSALLKNIPFCVPRDKATRPPDNVIDEGIGLQNFVLISDKTIAAVTFTNS